MKVAIVGATGMVGNEILAVLSAHNLAVDSYLFVASEKSVGTMIEFQGKSYPVIGLATAVAEKPTIAIFSAGVKLHWLGHLNLPRLVQRLSTIQVLLE